ncbi:bestrophin family protein [Sphingobacterium endophyticum]|uniref:bestrophin family protein n=1 Tax=Sphingobacterium endophyticum TaxID=2546448 RepID=UPI0012E0F49D|nr:bestrophin family ion channel [Sphingobacterium endophyticum]
MLVKKNVSFLGILFFSGHHIPWLTVWAVSVACLYQFTSLGEVAIPWLPASIIATAVAFYVGFKNNQAYDRVWEARKIWGAIVNSSRSWGNMLDNYISNLIREDPLSELQLKEIKQQLIYRHIAWLYTLRNQLLATTQWEHASQKGLVGKWGQRNITKYGVGIYTNDDIDSILKKYLTDEEYVRKTNYANYATELIHLQGIQLASLRQQNLLNDFRHLELQKMLNDFYDQQGKAERIKKFPLPRLYANLSFVFVCIFIILLPFCLMGEFSKLGDIGIWISVPLVVLVGWIYVSMELVGDYTENPFEGSYNDVPMLSICRTIEIDLLQMFDETDVPKPIQPIGNILM